MPDDLTPDAAPETEAPAAEDVNLDALPEDLDLGDPAPEAEATDAPEDPYAAFGGKETIEAAHKMWEATQSEDGVVRLWLEAGRSLGLGIAQMEALFGTPAPEGAEEAASDEDDDRLLTAKELREFFANQEAEKTAARRQEATAAAQQVVAGTLAEMGLKADDPSTAIILQMGDRYLKGPDDLSPESLKAAIAKGHADFEALVEQKAKDYVRSKVSQGKAVPKAPGGPAAPAPAPEGEPKSVAEAIERIRRAQDAQR